MARELAPCGTVTAFRRHRYRGEEIDEACREAWNAYMRDEEKRSGRPVARQRAYRRLARLYPEKFADLYREELAIRREELAAETTEETPR